MKNITIFLDCPILKTKNIYFFFFIVECEVGYIGSNCETKCPYPTYGSNCQKNCNCSKDNCNVSTGCRYIGIVFLLTFPKLKKNNNNTCIAVGITD